MENNKLDTAEIICLQMRGKETSEIRNMNVDKFNEWLDTKFLYRPTLSKAKWMLERQESMGIKTLTINDADFPSRLLAIGDHCPAVVYCLGNLDLLKEENAVGIIGARACDQEGYDMAYKLAKRYAQEGNIIVSGLALGCDTAAHRATLAVNGKTIAVVATGLNLVHPKENRDLQDDIIAHGGLILSEMPLNERATPIKLVMRNRIQAALSEKMILAQCPEKSGSMYTMNFAKDYGKECLAATFPHRTEANAGNYLLIDNGDAQPIQ